MNISLLVAGGNKTERLNTAKKIASEYSSSEDILILDASTDKGVAPTREFISKLNKKPYNSRLLTGVISEASNLTIEAQNTLLKTVEEPNETCRLILTAQSEYSLISTIYSRCQKIYLKFSGSFDQKLSEEILKSKLAARFELSEKLDLTDWVLYLRFLLKESIQNKHVSQELIGKLTKYIRLVEKVNSYSQIANQRLSRYLVVASIPKNIHTLA